MLGIVLVAHNDFAKSIKQVAEHVVGPLPDIACVSVLPEDDIDLKRQEIQTAIKKVDKKNPGVIILWLLLICWRKGNEKNSFNRN